MTVALGIAAGVMVLALHHVLLRAADSATAARASAVSADGLAEIDPPLLATAEYVDLIQVVDDTGRVRVTNSPDITRPLACPAAPR